MHPRARVPCGAPRRAAPRPREPLVAEFQRGDVAPMTAAARASFSTNVALAAPRESASRPSAPEPAKASRTRSPSSGPSIANSDSRTRSLVGRVCRPGGAWRSGARRTGRRRSAHAGIASRSISPWRSRSASREQHGSGPVSSGSESTISRAVPRARSSSSTSSGMRAKRNAARPDWRTPVSSPSPRRPRSISASRKPSSCSRAPAAAADSFGPEEQAQRLVLAAADAPAQLVQLRDPVALGVLDEHDRGVGHVDADLDDRRGDEDVGLAGREARPSRAASRRGRIWPCSSATRKSRSSPAASRSYSAVAARRLQRLGLLDERADDEGLAPGAQLLADPLVGAGALALAAGTCVAIGWRPCGSSRSSVTSRSP